MRTAHKPTTPMMHPFITRPPAPVRWPRKSPLSNQQGMSYLFVMILVVIMNISLMGVTQQWSVIMKRDKEAELLFRGTRIKEAIDQFVGDYEVQKATRPNRWPHTLKELTQKNPKRYLQVVYEDPMTGKPFELIKVGDEVHGVRSASMGSPYNLVKFKGAKTYQAIRFEATGTAAGCQPNPLNPLAPTCTTPASGQPTNTGTDPASPQPPPAPPDGVPSPPIPDTEP